MSNIGPDIGDTMPDIALNKPGGGTLKPSDFAGQKLVIFFYPKADTPGCTTENIEFSALKPQFDAAGTALLGVSKDPPAKHEKFRLKHGLCAQLASDPEENGLADALGIWVQKNMYGRKYMGIERTTYLVGPDGIIAQVWHKVKVRDHAQVVLEAALNA